MTVTRTRTRTQTQESALAAAYREFFAEHLRYVWRTLRRLGVAEKDCEDVAQEAFIAIHKHFAERDPARPVKPWIFGFAFRVALAHKRRASTKSEVLGEVVDAVADSAPDPATVTEARDAYRVVHAALAALPMEQRAVVIMHELDDIGAPEIAEALAIPLNTVYSRLRLGRDRLRTILAAEADGKEEPS